MERRRITLGTIGCDPELFFLDKNTNEVISAEGIIPGTKEEPHFISGEGHMIQLDNVLVEFGTPPAKSLEEFHNHLEFVFRYLKDTYGDKYIIGKMASAELDDKYLQSEQALLFGCEPDWNVWTMEGNPPPKAVSAQLRSAGGHVHVGISEDDPTMDETIGVVKMMDLCLGVPSILLDTDKRRKELYGKAGAFRFKPYLAEYRTLSNFWIHKKEYIDFVYNNTAKAIDMYNEKLDVEKLRPRIVDVINNNNKSEAEKLVKEFGLL